MKKFSVLLLVLGLTTLGLYTQNYQLKSYVVGSSATTTSNSNYTFKNTVGQPVIGQVSGSNNNVNLGFWYINAPNPLENLIISLNQGWNMVSSYVEASNTRVDTIFKQIEDEILIVKDNSGSIYVPSFKINTIVSWDITQGYQVYSTVDTNLTIVGEQVDPQSTPIYNSNGWNMLAYLRSSPLNSYTALASLTDRSNLLIAKDNSGLIYVPQFSINTIGNMQPTQGYQMYIVGIDTLLYPANGTPKLVPNTMTPIANKLIPQNNRTGRDMTLLINADLPDETEIGVYDQNDILIGSGAFYSEYAGLTIWGDNEYTDRKDGASENEILTVKILNNERLVEKRIQIIGTETDEQHYDLRFKNNSVLLGKIESANLTAEIFASPQPVVDRLELRIENIQGEKTIEIRNLKGKLLFSKVITVDELSIDMSEFSNSTYFVTVANESIRNTKKVIKAN